MVSRVVHVRGADMRDEIAALQQQLEVTPEFPPEVEQAAARAVAAPRLPELDRTDIPLVTIDPEGAMDLDQALHIRRTDSGFSVHYAIADVAAFVTPDDPVDVEARKRGQTLYGADAKVPLHPKAISEGAGSLLPGEVRPSLLWTINVDASGEGTEAVVERALVRSRSRHTYEEVQQALDAGTADELFGLLREVGELRMAREADRGGVSLPLPEQEIVLEGEHWRLGFRAMLPVEEWNAQISLLTGSAAASLMVYARVGLLRTLPPADPRDVKRLHRTAHALGIPWPAEMLYPEFIRSLDPEQPKHAAMLVACTRLLRGSGYVGFDGELPAQPQHAAIAGSTPTSRRPCGASSTATPARSAWPCAPSSRCRSGCSTDSPTYRRSWPGPGVRRVPTSAACSTCSRPLCSARGSVRRSTRSSSTWTRRTRRAVKSPSPNLPSRPGSPRPLRFRWGAGASHVE